MYKDKINFLLSKSIHHISFFVELNSSSRLPYYGPVLRGWLGSRLFDSKELWVAFRNQNIPFRPYFFYTSQGKSGVFIHFLFLEDLEELAEKMIKHLLTISELHVAGVDAEIKEVKLIRESFEKAPSSKYIKMQLLSPTTLYKEGKPRLYIELQLILDSLVRSINRYNKFYLNECYPIHWERSWNKIKAKTQKVDLKLFKWNQRRRTGPAIKMEGIYGNVSYLIEESNEEIDTILSLAQFYQIGKRTAFGFGKVKRL